MANRKSRIHKKNPTLTCGKRFFEGERVQLVRKPGGTITCPDGKCPNCNIVSRK